jgi:hypothetical protein
VDAILAPGLLDARDVEGHHRVQRVTRAQLDNERARAVDSRCSCRPVAPGLIAAFQAFGPDGHLVDPKQEAKVKALGAALAENLKKLY